MSELPSSYLFYMPRLALVCLALALVVLAALIDIRKFIIPNWLNAALLVLGLLFALTTTFHGSGFNWVTHIACCVLFFAAGTLLFAAGFMGGGDVKLLSVLAFWAGPNYLLPFLVYTAAAGGVVSVIYFFRAWLVRRGEYMAFVTILKSWAAKHEIGIKKPSHAKVIAAQPDLPHTESDVAVAPVEQQSLLKVPVPYGVAIAVGGVYVFASIARHLDKL